MLIRYRTPLALVHRIDSMDSRLDLDCSPPSLAPCEREGERMRQLFAAYQNFVGHDLPNQLVTVQAYSRLLEESDGPRSEESMMLLSRIGALSKTMGLQARRLFEIGNLLADPPWGPPVSLENVAEEVVAAIRCKMDATGIDFHLPDPAPHVPLAEALLLRVLNELVANAVAAIGSGRTGRIDVTGRWSAAGGSIGVRDDGVGLAPERIGGLLRPTRVGGLLVAHQAASLWGGRLHIESAVGEGTTITLTTGGRA